MLVEVLVVVGVLCIISTLYFLAYVAWVFLGLPTDLYLNLWLAVSGFLILAFGAFVFAWAFKVFPPRSVIRSTAHTILWFTGRRRIAPVKCGPLVTSGPYAYVRHPIYCGALFIALGLGLLFGFPLIVAGFVAFWFNIVIHFVEGAKGSIWR